MKILIVDDETLIAQGITRMIQKLDPDTYKVSTCFSVPEALQHLRQSHFDLLMTDISMPGLNGLDLIRLAREEHLVDTIYILSGHSDFEYAQSAISLGVSEYLLKPVDKEQLKNLLNRLSEQKCKSNEDNYYLVEHALKECLFNNHTESRHISQVFGSVCITIAEGLFSNTTGIPLSEAASFQQPDFHAYIFQIHQFPAYVFIVSAQKQSELLTYLRETYPSLHLGSVTGEIHTAEHLCSLYQSALHAALNEHAKDDASLYQILASLLNGIKPIAPPEESQSFYVAQILEQIYKHYQENITLDSISHTIGLSSDYAGKLFKKETGMNFPEYLNRHRITQMTEYMLQDPTLSFEQLAPLMGFSNINNFYRVFKKLMNTTPGKYKEALLPQEKES